MSFFTSLYAENGADELRCEAAWFVERALDELIRDQSWQWASATEYGGIVEEVRRRALCLIDDAEGSVEDDDMERLCALYPGGIDVLDSRAKSVYGGDYSTLSQRYACALAMTVEDLLGLETDER
ncbi:hypothetical protein [Bifidobacterium tissieri]|nr:hypothetical protein [Bifidobacterium tissieri]